MKWVGVLLLSATISCQHIREKPCANPQALCDPNALMLFGLVFQPSTRYLLVLGDSTMTSYQVNPSTGGLTLVNSVGATLSNAHSAVFNPVFSHVYVINQGGSYVSTYSIDTSTGRLAFLQTASISASGTDAALEPGGRLLFVTTGANGLISTLRASPSGLSQAAMLNAGTPVSAIAAIPETQEVYVNEDSSAVLRRYSYDSNGNLTQSSYTTGCLSTAYAAYSAPFMYLSCAAGQLKSYNGYLLSTVVVGSTPAQIAVAADGSPVLTATSAFLRLYRSAGGSMTFSASSGLNTTHGGAAISLNGAFAWSGRSSGVVEVTPMDGDSFLSFGPDVTASFAPVYMIPINTL